MKYKFSQSLVFILLLFGINVILFREWIFFGKVPVAFDFAVYNYQPWKIDFEDRFNQEPKKIGHDDIKIFYPQRKFITESLKKGELPFWNPFEFAGNVSLSNSQTAVFYPLFFLFLFLPQITAWSLLSFSTPIIAGIGLYLFLKQVVKNKSAIIYGALVFAFSSTIITRTEDGLVAGHSLIWLPWVLYGAEKYLTQKNFIASVILTLALTLSMLVGWFQFTFYIYLIAIFYILTRWLSQGKRRENRYLLYSLSIFPLSILLTAFHWLPAAEAMLYSPRGVLDTPQEFITRHLMPVSHLITLVIPNFFGHISSNNYYGASEFKEGVIAVGIVPLLIATLAIFTRYKNYQTKFFISTLIISLLIGLNSPISRGIIALKIPLISTFLPNRIFSLAVFSLAVLATFGFQELHKNQFYKLKKLILLTLSLFITGYLSVVGIYFYEKVLARSVGFSLFEKGIERYIQISIKESILPFIILIFLIIIFLITRQKKKNIILIAIFAATILSQIYRANRYLYFSESKHEFPENPITTFLQKNTQKDKSRFISLSYSRIPANIPTYYQLFTPEGIDAMYPIWYGEFARFYEGKEVKTDDILRIEATFAEEMERRRWQDPKTVNLLTHLGIRYIIVPQEAFHILPPEPAFKKVFSHKWHTVYEYNYAFPKAYFVADYKFTNHKDVSLQRIFHPAFFEKLEVILADNPKRIDFNRKDDYWIDLSNIDLVKKQEKLAIKIREDPYLFVRKALENIKNNPVKINSYDNNQLSLKADVDQDGFIVINESYFPGWSARVNGIEARIYRANHAFMAIPVKKGSHDIILTFIPQTFKLAKMLSISAFSAVIVVIMGIRIYRRN